jgi:hypothetical protein
VPASGTSPHGNAGLALAGAEALDVALHRLGGGVVAADHAAVEHGHARAGAAGGGVGDERVELLGALAEVDVRVVLEAHERGGVGDHGVAEVAVRVELGADGRGGADDRAHAGEQVALAVVVAVGDHRAVEAEQDHVDGHGAGEVGEQLVAQGLVGGAHGRAGGLGERGEALEQLVAARAREPAEHRERGGEQLRVVGDAAAHEVAGGEAARAGGDRRERVGLGGEAGGEHPHGAGTSATQSTTSRTPGGSADWAQVRAGYGAASRARVTSPSSA